MTWTPPASPITWQDFPNLSTAVSAAHLNQMEGYAATVGQSVVNYFPDPTTIESVSSGAVPHIFQAAKYGIVGDAVVDSQGNLVSGTDDTAAWQTLIAALPTDKAIIRVHGLSLISNPGALSYSLGFNTSRLTMIGDGPHTGFYLADNSNCAALRFNTDPGAVIVDPVLLDRLHLERLAIYANGYAQSDFTGINAALVVWAYRVARLKEVQIHQAHSTAAFIYDFRDVRISTCLIDTVVGQGAANGINLSGASWTGWQSQRASINDCDFIDVPNESVFLGGNNVAQVTGRGNRESYRNLRPRPASIVSFISQWQNATQAATAWSNLTNYSIGQWVSSGGFNYLAVAASGPGSSGAVTPGTNQLVWWLQNKPLAWSAATAYVLGQCAYYTTPTNPGTEPAWSNLTNYAVNSAVTQGGVPYVAVTASGPGNGGAVTPGSNSAVWQASIPIPGGFPLNFTALVANTNVAPVTANCTLNPKWQAGGPQFGIGANGFSVEGTAASPALDIVLEGNQGNGRNAAGEMVGENGCYLNVSATPGISMRSLSVSRNTFRGYLNAGQIFGDEGTSIDENLVDDCANGFLWGDASAYNTRQLSISRNKLRLGGLGNGTGIQALKTGTNVAVYGVGIDDNEIDGGATLGQLTAALTNAGGPYTSIAVTPLESALAPGQSMLLGTLIPGSASNAVVTVAPAGAAPGATSIPINSFTPTGTISSGTLVFPLVATLTVTVTSGVAITSITTTALPFPLQSGQWITLFDPTGANFPTPVQVAPAVAGVPIGATSIPINAITPGKTYGSGAPVAVLANRGLNLAGGLSRWHANRNHIRYVANDLLRLLVSGNTPQAGELLDNWGDTAGNAGLNIGAVGTLIPIRIEGGGWNGAQAGNLLPTSGLQIRNVWGTTPAKDVTTPGVPATGAAAVMPIYDGILAVTAGAGGATTIGLGTTTQGAAQDTATINVPTSATVLVPVKAGQKVYATYGVNTPTWQFFAQ